MKIFSIAAILLFMTPILAQAQGLDNLLRSNGRIYVVIAVILVIFLGLILYLIRIEKKIRKLEK